MMKSFVLLVILFLSLDVFAQNIEDAQSEHPFSLSQRMDSIENRNKAFNLYVNFQGSLDVYTDEVDEWMAHFKARQLRLEIMGNLSDKLFYRFRHRLNSDIKKQSLDNLAKATDIMYLGYQATDELSLVAGKQTLVWGGFEFDKNPIYVYEYSDFGDRLDIFMLGISLRYQPTENHELVFQLANSTNGRFSDEYPNLHEEAIKTSQVPLTYILNWNGNLLDNHLQTRWAYGVQTQAADRFSKMLTIGTKLLLPKFQLAVDYMRADEDLDRLKIASTDATSYFQGKQVGYFEDVTYNSLMTKLQYHPKTNWTIFAQGMYETASVNKVELFKNYRKSYGVLLGVEYIPLNFQEMKLFLVYVGRNYNFSDKLTHLNDYDTHRVSLGMAYRLKAY